MHSIRTGLLLAALVLSGPTLAQQPAAQQPAAQQPAAVGRTAEIHAVVEAVDQRERSVVLRGEDGALQTVFVPPEARNLPQVKPGDRVEITYSQAVAAAIARADGAGPAAASRGMNVAPPGARPAGALFQTVRVRVKVEAIDLRRNTVQVVGPSGNQRLVEVRKPRMQAFLRTLKPGDDVDVTVAEALTLRVLPPA